MVIKSLRIIGILCLLLSCKEAAQKFNGETINIIESPALIGSAQPFLYSNGTHLYMSWTQKINDTLHSINFSSLHNGSWSKPIEIVRGYNWFVNWADFPAIIENKGNLLTHFLQKSDTATFAYDIHLKISKNYGKDWNKDFIIHTDSTKTEHGFVTLLPNKNDSFFITWLDGRNTGGGTHGDEHSSSGAMNLRAATVMLDGNVINDELIDAKTCDCCQTSAAITPKGPIIVYRDRTDKEVRDIYISRLLDGSWTIPKPIFNDNWIIKGCPVNGPKAATYKNTLAVAWFTSAHMFSKVNLVFSNNSGATFNKPIHIDNGNALGRVDIALLDEDNALVSWMETTETGAALKIIKVNKNGTKGKPILVSKLSASRATGFPQFELLNDTIYLAWNDIENEKRIIKIKSLGVNIFNQ